MFAETSYTFDLAENADGSTTAIELGIVSATDADGHTVSYRIVASNAGRFTVDSGMGVVVYFGSGENFDGFADPANAFTLTVRASDGTASTR